MAVQLKEQGLRVSCTSYNSVDDLATTSVFGHLTAGYM
jgi:hypothetical protein